MPSTPNKVKSTRYKGPIKTKPLNTRDGEAWWDGVVNTQLEQQKHLIKDLSPAAVDVLAKWYADALLEGKMENETASALWQADYVRKPVDIRTFLMDNFYFGRSCSKFYPILIDAICEIFQPGSGISEIILTGSLGYGKSSVATAALGYVLYRLSCLKNPRGYYNLVGQAKLMIGIYSVSMKQAEDTIFYRLRNYIDASEYFNKVFPRDTNIDLRLKFPGSEIEVLFGSNLLHQVGSDMFAYTLDEANFFSVRQDNETKQMVSDAHKLYSAVHRRIQSRFMRSTGITAGMNILISSKRAKSDFIEERIKEESGQVSTRGLTGKISPNAYVVSFSKWEVNPERFPGDKFRVLVGDETYPSKILTPEDEVSETAEVVEVPPQFRRDFELDIDEALRDIAGRATFSASPFIRDRASITDAIRKHLAHPFKFESLTIGTKQDRHISDFYELRQACKIVDGNWRPKINPTAPRFIHCDLSLTNDFTGIVMGHISGFVKTNVVQPDGTVKKGSMPFVIIDFMLQIIPPVGDENDLGKIRSFIYYLRDLYPVEQVTTDGYACEDMKQILIKQGINADVLSVDKKEEPYMSLRSALFERRFAMYHYPPVIMELQYLERDIKKGKIDHPAKYPNGQKGRKDLSDGLASVTYQCITNENSLRMASNAGLGEDSYTPEDDAETTRMIEPPKPIPVSDLAVSQRDPVKSPSAVSKLRAPGGQAIDWNKMRELMNVSK